MNDDRPDHDELLHRALADEAAGVQAEPDWDDVRRRAARRAPRPMWLAAAALVVVALVGGAALALRDDDGDAGVIADDPTTTEAPPDTGAPTSTTTTSTTTIRPEASVSTWQVTPMGDALPLLLDVPRGERLGDDEVVAAITVPGDDEFQSLAVVVLSKSTGEVVRTLADGYNTVEGGVYGITLSPDRRTAFWVAATAACTNRIEAAPVDGSSAPIVFRHDANHIAFGGRGGYAIEIGDMCVSPATVEVGETVGGPTTLLTATDERLTTLESMAVLDEHLLFVPSLADTGSTGELHLVDRSSGSIEAVPAGPDRAESIGRLGVHSTPEGRLLALELCCVGDETPAATLLTLDGSEVVDRRPIDLDTRVHSASLDVDGDLLVVAGDDIGGLHVKGRLVRPGVLAVAG